MTKVGGRTVTIGTSTDDANNNGYELELDVNANQLIIRDQNSGNEITADVGQGFIQDVIRANTELRLPTYADNANAVQEDAQIWFNDGSGSDAAGIYHYDGGVVGPLETGAGSAPANLSGLTIDIDKDWGGYVITGAGHDGVQVPQIRELTMEDWESGTLDTDVWSGDTGSATVQSSVVESGSYALELSGGIYSVSGLESYPQPGDEFEFYVYLTDTDDIGALYFATQSETTISDGYRIDVQANDSLRLVKRKNQSNTTLISLNADVSSHFNEWLKAEVEWGTDGIFNIYLYDSNGNELASGDNSGSADEDFESGGVSLDSFNSSVTPTIYYDSIRVKRREPEAAANTKKGTTQLGNEVVPSGGINTGPQEVPPDHPNYPMVNLPVTNDLSQGEAVGYHMAINEEKALTVEAEADGSGGVQNRKIRPHDPFTSIETKVTYGPYIRDEFEHTPLDKRSINESIVPRGVDNERELARFDKSPDWNIVSGSPSIVSGELELPPGDTTAQIIELETTAEYGFWWFDGFNGNNGNGGATIMYPIYVDSNNWIRVKINSFNDATLQESIDGSISDINAQTPTDGSTVGVRYREVDNELEFWSHGGGTNPLIYGNNTIIGGQTSFEPSDSFTFRIEHTQGNTLTIPIIESHPLELI